MIQNLLSTRRQLLKTAALTAAAFAAPPFIRHSRAAGKLSIFLWDHWTGEPANAAQRAIIQEWAKKNAVDITVDFITSQGFKIQLTAAAEARAKTGHDIAMMPQWDTYIHRAALEPIDEIVEENKKLYGPLLPIAEYLTRIEGHYLSVQAPTGGQSFPSVSRIDLFKQHCDLDVVKLFPADVKKRDKKAIDGYTWEALLGYAAKLQKAGVPVGQPIGQTSDSPVWLGPLFASFGAYLVDAKGNTTANTPEVRAAMEYMKRLTMVMPKEVYAWDDAGNNKHILSGAGSWIQNPPSAWAIGAGTPEKPGASVDAASKLWHHDSPRGPKGRFRGGLVYAWGLWNFSKNKSAAKDLMRYMTKRDEIAKLGPVGRGYDYPMHTGLFNNPVWDNENPPKGTLYNYPIRGDEHLIVSGMPAPHNIAANMYVQATLPQMVARYTTGQNTLDEAIKWAEQEIEGFKREG